jgi:hypothetical protein
MKAFGHTAFVAAVVLVVLPVSAASGSDTFLAFGPKTYTRATGMPSSVKDTFSVLNPNTSYLMRVYNGGKGNPTSPEVFSAAIRLNGITVVRHSEFNPRVADVENPKGGPAGGVGPREAREPLSYIEKPIVLWRENELAVEMHARPDSVLTIEIVWVDDDPPTIVAAVTPPPNAAGWNNTDVTVVFSCADATSWVASCSAPIAITGEGANQVVTGTAIDGAGHTTSVSVVVNVDRAAPSIAAHLSGPPNAVGWHANEVTVSFDCSDALSGIQSCPGSVSVGDGAGQNVGGTAVDRAGEHGQRIRDAERRHGAADHKGQRRSPTQRGWLEQDRRDRQLRMLGCDERDRNLRAAGSDRERGRQPVDDRQHHRQSGS